MRSSCSRTSCRRSGQAARLISAKEVWNEIETAALSDTQLRADVGSWNLVRSRPWSDCFNRKARCMQQRNRENRACLIERHERPGEESSAPMSVAEHLHKMCEGVGVTTNLLERVRVSKIGKISNFFQNFIKFLAGSFLAVSKRNFARKYAFDSIFQALQDFHTFAPLQSQNFRKNRFEKSAIFVKIQQHFANHYVANFAKICQNLISKISSR